MKKHLMSLAALMIALTATMLTSCSNNELGEIVNPEEEASKPGTHVETLTIAFPEQTQTRVAIDGDHNLTGWELGDEVTLVRTYYEVTYGEFGPEGYIFNVEDTYTFTCTNAANGTFTGTMPNGFSVEDCQLAFFNATGFDTDGSSSLYFSPKTRASQNMKDVVMLVAKNDGGNFEMEIFGSILQVTNNTGADITASVKYSWFGYGKYYDCNESNYNDPYFDNFETNVGADVNHPITLSKDAPTYVYIPVINLNGGNENFAVGLSAAGDAANECSIVPFKTNPGNAKLFMKTLEAAAPAYEYVDLGLSVKWATMNVGATAPEEYGDYFAWGATEPLYEAGYAQENPQAHWKDGKAAGYTYVNTPYQTANTTRSSSTKWTKYLGSTTSSYKDPSATDEDALKTVLDPEDDAAHVNWGGSWRMPTCVELDELYDNCTWTWTTLNGVNGYKVQSNKAGYTDNWIFLPAAGYRDGLGLSLVDRYGYYWSSSLSTVGSYMAYQFEIGSKSNVNPRLLGQSVRPVCE